MCAAAACPTPSVSDAGPSVGRDIAVPVTDASGEAGQRDGGLPDVARDTTAGDQGGADAGHDGGRDGGAGDAVGSPCVEEGVEGHRDTRGFCVRAPLTRSIPVLTQPGVDGGAASDTGYAETLQDIDHVCALSYGAHRGAIYVRAEPRYCLCSTFPICPDTLPCIYEVRGWVSVDGEVSPAQADYDLGGRHRIDSVWIRYDDTVFRYDHSSLGAGVRPCHPPDCISHVYQAEPGELDGQWYTVNGTLVEEGCTLAERLLPNVCVRVESDGVVPDTLVDDFSRCPGDPYADAG